MGHAIEHYQRQGQQPGMAREPSPALCGQPAIRWKRSHEMSSKAPEEAANAATTLGADLHGHAGLKPAREAPELQPGMGGPRED